MYVATVKPLIVDSPKYGHSIINLSTKDTTYSPSIIPTIYFEPPKEENLSTKSKSAEFMYVVPKVSFIRRFYCISCFSDFFALIRFMYV